MNFREKYKPSVSRRSLLMIAGCVWAIAGGILITRALVQLFIIRHYLLLELFLGVVFGIAFYLILFTRISKKHITRIQLIKVDNPCFFSFFNFRSYILMMIMITGGITLRKLNVINPNILWTFYLTMGIPLAISAYRFFYSWFKNKQTR
ncbi:MAG: hypothetical protein NTX61_19085 [Bacteroidetes bacterium]|nr:hypothetical protein [Bacteroidota bacterium]